MFDYLSDILAQRLCSATQFKINLVCFGTKFSIKMEVANKMSEKKGTRVKKDIVSFINPIIRQFKSLKLYALVIKKKV